MTKCMGIAMLLMTIATVSVHLGLPQAIGQVVMKILKCHKCLSFWLTLIGLLWYGCPLIVATLLSLLSAYMSHWLALLLIVFNNIYNKIWQRLNRNK